LANFILFRVKNFIELNTKCDEFPKLKLVANKVHNIANIITFIPLLEDLHRNLLHNMNVKVAEIGESLIIAPQQLYKLSVGFYEDKLKYLQSAVTEICDIVPDINEAFMNTIIISSIESLGRYFHFEERKCARGLASFDQTVFNIYSFFKALRKSKILQDVLPSIGEYYKSLYIYKASRSMCCY
jgi:hypothetical protein